jgi:hypothetical protein
MASTLLVAPLYHFMGSLTQLERGVLMIENLLEDIFFCLVPHLFHGNLESNALLLTPQLKQSIKLWLMVLLRFFGYTIF